MIKIIKPNRCETGYTHNRKAEYLLDSVDDLALLPSDAVVGSEAYLSDMSVVYRKSPKGEWKEKVEDSGGFGGALTDDLNIGSTVSTDDAQLRIAKQGSDGKGYQMGSYISGGNMARTDYIADGFISNFMQLGPIETGFGKPVRVSSGGTGVTSYEELKTKLDVIPNPVTASVGQTLAVKSVDENGKPTEWETIETNTFLTNEDKAAIDQNIVRLSDKKE